LAGINKIEVNVEAQIGNFGVYCWVDGKMQDGIGTSLLLNLPFAMFSLDLW